MREKYMMLLWQAILTVHGHTPSFSIAYKPYLYLPDHLSPKAVYLMGGDQATEEYMNCINILKDRDIPVFYPESGKRIVIEASVLPDDPGWKPENMPVIFSIAPKGEIPDHFHFVASFLVNESHVTFRGLKFTGYAYPNTRYFPIARFNKEKSDLYVEQCLFVGDEDAFHLQVGIIAHGDSIKADHCVFYNVRNSVVFWEGSGEGNKKGNATQSGIWTAAPDEDFIFKNNVVSDYLRSEINRTLIKIKNN